MANGKKATAEVDKVRPYLEGVAKNLVDRLYGPDGLPWGAPLAELEDVVVPVREALSERMLAQALERQAQAEQRPEVYQSCPSCAKLIPRDAGGAEAKVSEAETLPAEDGKSGRYWRKDKIGLLMTMVSAVSATDQGCSKKAERTGFEPVVGLLTLRRFSKPLV
jgi:hypothetical protein